MNQPSMSSTPTLPSLRERARTQLSSNAHDALVGRDASSALKVLFDLASSPDTAHDALALLHELQVHQVELDLQNEELLASRAELESTCQRQQLLHDAWPSAHITLDAAGAVLACNAQALACLQQTLPTLQGTPLASWLPIQDTPRLQAWLSQVQQTQTRQSLQLTLTVRGRAPQTVCAAACPNPLAPGVLITWVDVPPIE